MNTPKTLTDLRYQDNVITLKNGQIIEAEANRFFHELFSPVLPVSVHLIFQEREADDCEGDPVYLGGSITRVYEAYQDSGSSEYLYLIAKD